MSSPLPFHLACEPAAAPAADTLLRVEFSSAAAPSDDPRVVRVGLDLAGASNLGEHWRSTLPVRHGRDDGFGWSDNGEVMFAQMHLPEDALADTERAAFEAYSRISDFIRARGYPQLLRAWNYFHDIHRGAGDDERYRRFVAGRYRALAQAPDFGAGFELRLPAATAIGTHAGGMLIYFIAGKHAGLQIENPRQVSAFEYPREYGPRSPSFSRATLLHGAGEACLLVSGTASIVGHATQHVGDAGAQLVEISRNLKALQLRAQRQLGAETAWQPASLKLYLRDPGLLPALKERLAEEFGAGAPLICLHGDVCRTDLLVEIEAVYHSKG